MFQSLSTTGIGSLPHTDPEEACDIILRSVDIPFWPQLPHRSFLELMVPQYSEGFPFVKIEGEHVNIVKAEEQAVSAFYEAVADKRGFPISTEYAAGLYAFIDILKKGGKRFSAVKGHITGPLTFTLSLTDNQKRPLYFDEELRELALELLKGKAGWQIGMLRPYAEKVLIFIDEPILSALGTSAYIGVNADEASRMLQEIVRHIKSCGGIAGIHCCGKADWPLILSSGIDVFNFDSYFYWDTLGIYPEEIKAFIDNGGFIAWGVVPTTDIVREVTVEGLSEQLERGLTSLEKIGVPRDKLLRQSLLTPSCGTGSLRTEDAGKVFSLLKDLRSRYAGG
ncbi:MAG: methionine synthase [Nitrospiraceae bacterium]|nr:MAG: methionine synthase [Nitrospiraceae bacterium]